ncbi:hypothetical protein IE81DRAFT_350005 [Ceraceosorus guamensis]|uniref:Uncharacterized protein n=1 Tax=Ceraceosorus guamensis TaxID=1522189 RepID=A0A316VW06_9BASI|nr:hypothetical protein IE81DRAFT_350005 [Ceraceosorus guamensis]PWN39625.1 hypothetical protein IE81DRAFT_350005 [Ceraceosorus guamensis]
MTRVSLMYADEITDTLVVVYPRGLALIRPYSQMVSNRQPISVAVLHYSFGEISEADTPPLATEERTGFGNGVVQVISNVRTVDEEIAEHSILFDLDSFRLEPTRASR